MDKVIQLRAVDRKRLNQLQERTTNALSHENIWYIHTVLAQCFLPKTRDWMRQNRDYSIILTSGAIQNPRNLKELLDAGLPYGPKPRLFQSYICTQVIKQQSPVIPVERSMTAMMRELGLTSNWRQKRHHRPAGALVPTIQRGYGNAFDTGA